MAKILELDGRKPKYLLRTEPSALVYHLSICKISPLKGKGKEYRTLTVYFLKRSYSSNQIIDSFARAVNSDTACFSASEGSVISGICADFLTKAERDQLVEIMKTFKPAGEVQTVTS